MCKCEHCVRDTISVPFLTVDMSQHRIDERNHLIMQMKIMRVGEGGEEGENGLVHENVVAKAYRRRN